MAGMFYSLQEAAEKLNKTEEEVKQLAQEGKLREFRDGPNLLFKIEEVEALLSEESVQAPQETPEAMIPEEIALELEIPEAEALEVEIPEAEALEAEIPEAEALEAEIPAADDVELEIPEGEAEALEPEVPDIEDLGGEIPEAEELEELELSIPEEEAPSIEGLDESLGDEMLAPPEEAMGTSEILLAPETGAPAAPNELTDADTALTGEGINVLGESEADYEITDDTLAETAIPMGTGGTGPEMPLEEIEGDVNLDSFGSGSGLLDLSLQADDTSLGGILDEIYTDEVEGQGQEAALAEVGDSPEDLAAGAEGMMDEEEAPVVSEPTPDVPMALARPYVEAAPDMASNTLGMLLFLPLLVIIYTIVVALSGQKDMMPSILSGIKGFIWYIMGGAAGIALLVSVVALMAGGGGTAKVKKPKAPKAPKAKKEKKPKKEKPPKKPKEPKPKKPKKEKKKKKK